MKLSEKAGKKAEKDREKVPSAQGFPLFPPPGAPLQAALLCSALHFLDRRQMTQDIFDKTCHVYYSFLRQNRDFYTARRQGGAARSGESRIRGRLRSDEGSFSRKYSVYRRKKCQKQGAFCPEDAEAGSCGPVNRREDIGRKLEDGCYPPPYRSFNGITTQYGAHFILRIDKMLMKPKYYDNIINGVKGRLWPNVLICHGYRDSKNFWFAKTPRLVPELLPIRNATLSSVRYAADRTDLTVHFTDDALDILLNVPRIFLPAVLKGYVAWAKEHNVTEVTAKETRFA